MGDPAVLRKLLAHVEAATGPSDELGKALSAWLYAETPTDQWPAVAMLPHYACGNRLEAIGAALALVERVLPAANCYGIEREPRRLTAYVSRNNVASGHWYHDAEHHSAPLAILAALLKAKIADHV